MIIPLADQPFDVLADRLENLNVTKISTMLSHKTLRADLRKIVERLKGEMRNLDYDLNLLSKKPNMEAARNLIGGNAVYTMEGAPKLKAWKQSYVSVSSLRRIAYLTIPSIYDDLLVLDAHIDAFKTSKKLATPNGIALIQRIVDAVRRALELMHHVRVGCYSRVPRNAFSHIALCVLALILWRSGPHANTHIADAYVV